MQAFIVKGKKTQSAKVYSTDYVYLFYTKTAKTETELLANFNEVKQYGTDITNFKLITKGLYDQRYALRNILGKRIGSMVKGNSLIQANFMLSEFIAGIGSVNIT